MIYTTNKFKSFHVFIFSMQTRSKETVVEELELIDWFYTEYPKERRIKRFQHGYKKMKILGIISHYPNGVSKKEIQNKLPYKLNNYLYELRMEGLIESTYPYSPGTRYICTEDGLNTYKCLLEIALEARRLWTFE